MKKIAKVASDISGFTLIELMVALLVLAIGLLGLAGLQAKGLSNNHNAYLRTQATLLAQDMADRMRANPSGVSQGDYYDGQTAQQTSDCLASAGCSALLMAKNDYYEWTTAGAGGMSVANLPNGHSVVCLDSTPNDLTPLPTPNAPGCDGLGSVYAIKIWWDEREKNTQGNSNTVTKNFVMSFRP